MDGGKRVEVIGCSTDEIIDPRQIGWVTYREGDAIVRCKVIRGAKMHPFLAHVVGFGQGSRVRVVEYCNETWREKSKELLRSFRTAVGDRYFFEALPGESSGAGSEASEDSKKKSAGIPIEEES